MSSDFLFVYGTLREKYPLVLKKQVADHLKMVGKGKIRAKLYDLGSYPAAIEGSWINEITGDVYAVTDFEKLFPVLDEYEGLEYRREKTEVRMDSGELLIAWVYWYTGEIDENLLIRENDYLDYLKNKKDRFV